MVGEKESVYEVRRQQTLYSDELDLGLNCAEASKMSALA